MSRHAPLRGPKAEAAAGTLTVWLSRPGSHRCEHIQPARISDVLRERAVTVWVDVKDPGEAELDLLREEFGFHRLALEDVAKQRQRAKVDEYPGYFFVVLYAPLPTEPDGEVRLVEIELFVGRNYVVTVHRGDVPGLQESVRRWERTEATLREQVGFLLHVITDAVVDGYFPIVEALEERLDRLESAMFGVSAAVFDPGELLAIKRDLYTLRKAIYPLREVFNTFLRRDNAIFSPETYPYFQDAYDHVLRLLDIIDIERDMATGTLEAQLSIVSNRLNETMKRLTVVAICVAVLGAVFGAWGMNFDEVPLHHLGRLGFYIVSLGTFTVLGIGLWVTKRMGLW